MSRIKKAMLYAAKNNENFHLWWHPHNFGCNLPENLAFLEKIVRHFHLLNQQYGMRSLSMAELAALGESAQ